MPRYLVSFDDGSMDHISDEDLPEVGRDSHAAVIGGFSIIEVASLEEAVEWRPSVVSETASTSPRSAGSLTPGRTRGVDDAPASAAGGVRAGRR